MNVHDITRDEFMLTGPFAYCGYDWWWHSFTAVSDKTGEERPFYIEFFTCNPALAESEPVLGQLPENQKKHKKPSYLMVNVGTWGKDHAQLHGFYPWSEVRMHKTAPFKIAAGNCYLSERATRGTVSVTGSSEHPEWMCDDGTITWDLKIDKKIAFNVGYGADKILREAKGFQMFWHSEGMKTFYSGTISYNGEEYSVTPEKCFGYADKNWGSDFTSPWVWLSSCSLKSNLSGKRLENSVFDIGGGRPVIFGVPIERKLLGAFWYEGTNYEFNFSKFWTGSKTKFKCSETDDEVIWHVIQENRDAVLVSDIKCKKEDMLHIKYEAPDGSMKHRRLWNGGNGTGRLRLYRKTENRLYLIDDIAADHIGCEYGEYCE